MIIHEEKNFVLRDMFDKDRSYHYKVYNVTTKKGKNSITKPVLVFHTYEGDGDDTLRYIEDAVEEICKIHELFPPDIKVYECRKDLYSHIEMRYESRRFRGTSWVHLTSEEKEDLLKKIL